jgi:hypothetical protein
MSRYEPKVRPYLALTRFLSTCVGVFSASLGENSGAMSDSDELPAMPRTPREDGEGMSRNRGSRDVERCQPRTQHSKPEGVGCALTWLREQQDERCRRPRLGGEPPHRNYGGGAPVLWRRRSRRSAKDGSLQNGPKSMIAAHAKSGAP